MRLHVANHPLIDHKLSVLRDERTPSAVFRQLVDELVTLLAYEATREVRTEEVEIRTPVALAQCRRLADPRPIVVPILRAGLGMLEGMTRLLPTAEVGFLGMKRDEDTLEVETYANRLPDDLSGRQCFVVDPMLATGHTLVAAIDYLLERGARDVTALCLPRLFLIFLEFFSYSSFKIFRDRALFYDNYITFSVTNNTLRN